ncbi:MAG: hypothetical protein WBE18_06745 [Gammaproteobacteria bacterium]
MRTISSFKKTFFGLSLLCANTFAVAASNQSLGQIAQQLTGPIMQTTHLLETICLICGVGLVLASLLKYKAHRNNPREIPFSTPLMLLVFGLALIVLGLIPPMIVGKR